jgi:hypothetical protein
MTIYELFIPIIIIALWLYPWQLVVFVISFIIWLENKKILL